MTGGAPTSPGAAQGGVLGQPWTAAGEASGQGRRGRYRQRGGAGTEATGRHDGPGGRHVSLVLPSPGTGCLTPWYESYHRDNYWHALS